MCACVCIYVYPRLTISSNEHHSLACLTMTVRMLTVYLCNSSSPPKFLVSNHLTNREVCPDLTPPPRVPVRLPRHNRINLNHPVLRAKSEQLRTSRMVLIPRFSIFSSDQKFEPVRRVSLPTRPCTIASSTTPQPPPPRQSRPPAPAFPPHNSTNFTRKRLWGVPHRSSEGQPGLLLESILCALSFSGDTKSLQQILFSSFCI